MRSARMLLLPNISQNQPMKDTKLGKRSLEAINFVEGQENEEPMMKKRVSPVNTDGMYTHQHSSTQKNVYNANSSFQTSMEQCNENSTNVSIVSTESLKSSQRLTLEVPSAALVPSLTVPKSWYATNDINWAPEDDDTYAWFIFERKLKEESQFVLEEPVYEHIQHVVTPTSHNCMFNFLCEVAQEQRLSFATFLHAMHVFDFVMSRMSIGRNDFLLAGCASLMLASKLEEIYPPTSDALMSHANFVFSRAELFRFERVLLELLKFNISLPTRLQFAEYLGKMQKMSKRQGILLQYLIGLSMLNFDLNYYKNSVVAAAALVVTFQLTNPSRDMPSFLTHLSQIIDCSIQEIHTCVVHIRYVHFIAQTGPESHSFVPPSMKRTHNTINNNANNNVNNGNNSTNFSSKILKPLSTQLLDWFNSDESLNVVDITALPLYGLDMSLCVNKSVKTVEWIKQQQQKQQKPQRYIDFTSEKTWRETLALIREELRLAQKNNPQVNCWNLLSLTINQLMLCNVKDLTPAEQEVVHDFAVSCHTVLQFEQSKRDGIRQGDEHIMKLPDSRNMVYESEYFQNQRYEVSKIARRLHMNNTNTNTTTTTNYSIANANANKNSTNKNSANNNNLSNSKYNITKYYSKAKSTTTASNAAEDPNAIAMAMQLGIGI